MPQDPQLLQGHMAHQEDGVAFCASPIKHDMQTTVLTLQHCIGGISSEPFKKVM